MICKNWKMTPMVAAGLVVLTTSAYGTGVGLNWQVAATATDNNWSTTTNWYDFVTASNIAPTNNDGINFYDASITVGGPVMGTSYNDLTDLLIGGHGLTGGWTGNALIFRNDATNSIPWIVNGNAFKIANANSIRVDSSIAAPQVVTINAPVGTDSTSAGYVAVHTTFGANTLLLKGGFSTLGRLDKNGAGWSNDAAGTLVFDGGTVNIGNQLKINNGHVVFSGGVQATIGNSNGILFAAVPVVASGGTVTPRLTITGAGTLVSTTRMSNNFSTTIASDVVISDGAVYASTGGFTGGNAANTIAFDNGTMRGLGNNAEYMVATAGLAVDIKAGGLIVDTNSISMNMSTDMAGVGGLTKISAGSLILKGANTYAGDTNVNQGSLIVDGSVTGAVLVNNDSTLGGIGSVASVNATGASTINPGNALNPIGTLTITGNTSLSSNLSIALGAGVSDLLSIGGDLTLGASSALTLSGTADDVTDYVLATYTGTLSGSFASITGLPTGYTLDYGTGSNSSIILKVATVSYLPGDANMDNIVDGFDFDILAQNFGAAGTWATGDFNNDGLVDGFDFDILAQNFGTSASSLNVSTVPEPATAALLVLGSLGLIARRRLK